MRYKDNNYYNKQRTMLTKYGTNLRSKVMSIVYLVIMNYYSLDYPFKHGYIG